MPSIAANREKQLVAISSLVAAVGLTFGKLVIGYWTNSLGILSEAAHSGLDLVAAAVTVWAVRMSARPADLDHTYGHGKFENLSALVETLLLLATCVWILWEAARRLFFAGPVHVDANAWAFLVVIVSIVVDFSRSRALMRAARKYHSQALEADAIHFSTDIWSSCVVLLGLLGVLAAHRLNLPGLIKADAVAAMGVALIVVWVCIQLGRRSIDDLSDRIPENIRREVADAAARVPGVEQVSQVRVRRAGGEVFADMKVTVDRSAALEGAHEVASRAENAVRSILPAADVVVHVEPTPPGTEDPLGIVKALAARHGLGTHGLRVYEAGEARVLELHLEVAPNLSLEEAHRQASEFEDALRQGLPGIARVNTHIEPAGQPEVTLQAHQISEKQIYEALFKFFTANPEMHQPHHVHVQRIGGLLTVSLHVRLDPSTGIVDAHNASQRLESFLRERVQGIDRVMIHVEPAKAH